MRDSDQSGAASAVVTHAKRWRCGDATLPKPAKRDFVQFMLLGLIQHQDLTTMRCTTMRCCGLARMQDAANYREIVQR